MKPIQNKMLNVKDFAKSITKLPSFPSTNNFKYLDIPSNISLMMISKIPTADSIPA